MRRFKLAASVATIAALAVPSFALSASSTVEVGQSGDSFSPASTSVVSGDTVTWHFAGGGHDVDGGAAFGTSPSKQAVGTSYSHTFTAPGSYPFVCDFHGGMSGTIIVTAASSPDPAPAPTPSPTPTPGHPAPTPPPSSGPSETDPPTSAPGPSAPPTKAAPSKKHRKHHLHKKHKAVKHHKKHKLGKKHRAKR